MSAHGSGDHLSRTPALSVHPHMAWLIVHGFKPVENRNWRTQHRGPLLIHASTWPCEAPAILLPDLEARYGIRVPEYPDEWPTGGVIGVVDLVDIVERHPSPFFTGKFGWVLERPRPLPFGRCRGMPCLFKPDTDVGNQQPLL